MRLLWTGPRGRAVCWLTIVVLILTGCLPPGPERHGAAATMGVGGVIGPGVATTRARGAAPEPAEQAFGALPLLFVENRGQTDPRVSHYVQAGGASVFFTSTTVTHLLRTPAVDDDEARARAKSPAAMDLSEEAPAEPMLAAAAGSLPAAPARQAVGQAQGQLAEPSRWQRWAVEVELVGADPGVRPRGEGPAPTVVSYFTGQEADWKTGLPTYGGVVYADAWPGVDLVYEGVGGRLKSSYLVRPGADPGRIALAYRGATSVELGEAGGLEVETPAGGFMEEAPTAYQERDGERVTVEAGYRLEASPDLGATLVTFDLAPYDPALPLVIDPVVLYKKPLGGPGQDAVMGVEVDNAGSVYVTGVTQGLPAGVPAAGPDTSHNGNWDVYVGKLNAAGDAFVYLGYIGSSGIEDGSDIAVDGARRAYVVGATDAGPAGPGTPNGFPVKVGPSLTKRTSWDGFVARVSASGTTLEYAGYVGGNGVDIVNGVAVDAAGNAYLAGTTTSTKASGFPWKIGPGLDNSGGDDGFVARVRADGTQFEYAGFVGTARSDGLLDVAVDWAGVAYAVGTTRGHVPGRTDVNVMLVKLTPDGAGLDYWGGWGGARDDLAKAIAIDASGAVYVAGVTNSADFPVGPGTALRGAYDGFVTKLDPQTNQLVYSRFLGGDGSDGAYGIAVDDSHRAYVTGATQSTPGQGFPVVVGPDLSYDGLVDGFLVQLTTNGERLVFGSYFEGETGSPGTQLVDVAMDQQGNVYVVGLGVESFNPEAAPAGQHGVIGKLGEPVAPPQSPPANNCEPRPAVRIATTVTAAGALQVTVTAGTTAGMPVNTLREIRFGAASNATLDIPLGPSGSDGNITYVLPTRPTQVTFTVRRVASGPFQVPLEVVDDCLPVWKTFVGAGAGVR